MSVKLRTWMPSHEWCSGSELDQPVDGSAESRPVLDPEFRAGDHPARLVSDQLADDAEESSQVSRSQESAPRLAMTGDEAVAHAFGQADPHVVVIGQTAHQDRLMLHLAATVSRGDGRVQLLNVESAHAAISAALGVSAAGGRVVTATGGAGLAGMIEAYHNVGALRLPVVLAMINRHAGGLLNVYGDHTDAMLARDAPWIQIHAENVQEAYDNALQAFRIAEDDRLRLPVAVCHDGSNVSDTLEPVLSLTDEQVHDFVGDFVAPVDLLDVDNPRAAGPVVMPDRIAHLYAQVAEAMRWVPQVVDEVSAEYARLTGRSYGSIEAYHMDDAEVAILALGSICGTVRATVDLLRANGVRAGLVKIRVFRPFPMKVLADTLTGGSLRALAAIDRSVELGSGGPLFAETAAALLAHRGSPPARLPILVNVMASLGGRELTQADVNGVFAHLLAIADGREIPGDDPVRFLGVDDAVEASTQAQAVESPLCGTGFQPVGLQNSRMGSQERADRASLCSFIVFLGRGGQGARTAAHVLAHAMIDQGHWARSSPVHGPERTGGFVRASLRIADAPLAEREQIREPDVFVILDDTLLESGLAELTRMRPGGLLLVNTRQTRQQVRDCLSVSDLCVRPETLESDRLEAGPTHSKRTLRIHTVDATGIALAETGFRRPGTAMLAALIRLLGFADIEILKRAFTERMRLLTTDELTANLRAMDRVAAECQSEG